MGAPPRLFKRSNPLRNSVDRNGTGSFADLSEQARLLAAGALLGFDRGDRGHVENAARGHRRGENCAGREGPIRIGPTGSASASTLII